MGSSTAKSQDPMHFVLFSVRKEITRNREWIFPACGHMKTCGHAARFAYCGPAGMTRPWSERSKGRRSSGFSLVELMVTITIISLLGAILVPTVLHAKRRTLATAVTNDLRVFATAFDTYAHEIGAWPAEVDAGVFP